MSARKDQTLEDKGLETLASRWKWFVVAAALGFALYFVLNKSNEIRFFALPDTDDNMRMMQVRALLNGQGWYDLRQYRLNPPFGANIHWSRLVDLPIAGLILLFRPLAGAGAERVAAAIAPMLPYVLLLFSIALTVRRLIDPRAYALAFLALIFAASTNGMFMPMRIDHHGWQLALLALGVSAIADPKRVRGGITLGIASSLSLAIGLEMLIYLALAGVTMVLFWIDDPAERDRLRPYAVTLGGGTSAAFLLFASNDNRAAVCDALSPVWLSDAVLAGALLFLLALLSPADWKRRLALAAAAGAVVAAFHALAWPHCLQRLEGVSPEVEQLWLSHVREARPFYRHGWRIAPLIIALPITGAIGWGMLIWLRRKDRELLRRTIGAAIPAFAALLLLFWQTRTGPAAQMLATIGAATLAWTFLPPLWNSRHSVIRVLGTTVAVVVFVGALTPLILNIVPPEKTTPFQKSIGVANRLCASIWGLRPVAQQPRGMVMTFVDLGPRLITVTHHDAVTGPYHRNGDQIADVMKFWRGDAVQARAIAAKYKANYVLSCPNSSTATIFMSETPKGFYMQLEQGRIPSWMKPVPLPKDSPYKMWKIVA
jgi:hypothetical protein